MNPAYQSRCDRSLARAIASTLGRIISERGFATDDDVSRYGCLACVDGYWDRKRRVARVPARPAAGSKVGPRRQHSVAVRLHIHRRLAANTVDWRSTVGRQLESRRSVASTDARI